MSMDNELETTLPSMVSLGDAPDAVCHDVIPDLRVPTLRNRGYRMPGAIARTLISTAVGALATSCVPTAVQWPMRIAVGWVAGSGVFLALIWAIILRMSPAETRRRAEADDPGRAAVLLIAVFASCLSLLAATRVIAVASDLEDPHERLIWTAMGCAAVVTSWLLTHSVYALRYARLYYRRVSKNPSQANAPKGMTFPGGRPPCDLDFAYFAFTLGTCFQTSDVAVNCTRVRRAVLVHVLVSFAYNTTIIASVVNLLH